MEYKEVVLTIEPFSEDVADAIAASLGDCGFDGFTQSDKELFAYIPAKDFREGLVDEDPVVTFFRQNFRITERVESVPDKDWNAEWEANFTPIKVDNDIMIRAGFHQADPAVKYDIVIEPKMSFGTGHHATTVLMLRSILSLGDLSGKQVLDMGCGTGILSLLASKRGAAHVVGIDIDEWAFENAGENMRKNGIDNISVKIGDASLLESEGEFNVILANINRNILLRDMQYYVAHLVIEGTMIISGFYEHELPMLIEEAERLGMKYKSHMVENEWCAAIFIK